MAAGVILLAGCGHAVSDDDCRRIADHLREVWEDEAKERAHPAAVTDGRSAGLVRSGGDRLVADWSAECKRDLVGRRVTEGELDCLLGAKTADRVAKCAEP